jgi:hypothetical protein
LDKPGSPADAPSDAPASAFTATLITGTAVVGMLAATSMLASALAVRTVLGDHSTVWATVLISAGTLVGTLTCSWLLQPSLSRLVARITGIR